jgi:AraC-like DNA-binding protein
MNDELRPDHNNPPTPIEFAKLAMADVSAWMADHPVILSEDDARQAKLHIDRAKAALEAVEAERDGKVRPLNEQVKAINAEYKAIHNADAKSPGTLDKILNELKSRLGAFLRAEEDRRQREAEEQRRKLEDAERLAREAEAREAEALENAAAGEIGVDVAAVTGEADAAFKAFERQSRFAERAERDTKVKIGGGFGNAASLRTKETLILENAAACLKSVGVTPKIEDAMLSATRDYRKIKGELPWGVRAETERALYWRPFPIPSRTRLWPSMTL